MSEETHARGNRKSRIGVVISDAMDKTIVVNVERRTQHPLYRKVLRKYKRLNAHDDENKARRGDRVRIEETRPQSKNKHWRLVEVLEVAHVA